MSLFWKGAVGWPIPSKNMDNLEKNQRKFSELKFGTFIHFNSATIQFQVGNIVDWEFDCENLGVKRAFPFAEEMWNPAELDCQQWAKTTKAAGCQFAALTAKHHEGFCLWPSAWTEHCVKRATCKTDVVQAYLDAFRQEQIAAGLYFSILDLTAGIGKRSCTQTQKEMIKGQLTELLTGYGDIPFLFVDGWNAPWGGPSYERLPFEEINQLVKSLQPNCLLINIGATRENQGTDIPCFENAAGQELDTSGFGVSCNKLTETWFWRRDDARKAPKSAEWAAEKIKQCCSINANFMLNLSPNPQGKLEDNLICTFQRIGKITSSIFSGGNHGKL